MYKLARDPNVDVRPYCAGTWWPRAGTLCMWHSWAPSSGVTFLSMPAWVWNLFGRRLAAQLRCVLMLPCLFSTTSAHCKSSEGGASAVSWPILCTEIDCNTVLLQDTPQAHRGFLCRARAVDIHSLYRHASEQGLRLVLCGEAFIKKMRCLHRIGAQPLVMQEEKCCQL